jgi:hypothetical protein
MSFLYGCEEGDAGNRRFALQRTSPFTPGKSLAI